MKSDYTSSFARDGYAVFPEVLSFDAIEVLRAAIERIPAGEAVRRKRSVYGVRNLLETSPEVCRLATRPEIWRLVTPILGAAAFAARAIFSTRRPMRIGCWGGIRTV